MSKSQQNEAKSEKMSKSQQSQQKSAKSAKVSKSQNMTFCSELFLAESRNCRKLEFWRFLLLK
jgi:hypothetical protein